MQRGLECTYVLRSEWRWISLDETLLLPDWKEQQPLLLVSYVVHARDRSVDGKTLLDTGVRQPANEAEWTLKLRVPFIA